MKPCASESQLSDALLPLGEVSVRVWNAKYRSQGGRVDQSIEDTWRRVARSLAQVEKSDREVWERRFYAALEGFSFLPGGRILASAGTSRKATLFNCFMMGSIEDSLSGIFAALKESAATMEQGGGIGCDFSTLGPRGQQDSGSAPVAPGPLSYMSVWDSMCATILASGARRGAMMGVLRCDHPDIEQFIEAKRSGENLRHFNLSVMVSDEFMAALEADAEWLLVFPLAGTAGGTGYETVAGPWSGSEATQRCRVYRRVRARDLWTKITSATYEYAEPGVIFMDRVQRQNNLWYCEHILGTNPCGEIPLPAYGACNLGSINLTRFVRAPFAPCAHLDIRGISATAAVATRMLDNDYEASRFPLRKQQEIARVSRRIGLGLTGLADALAMLNIPYGSEPSLKLTGRIMRTICETAYRTSTEIAREKGSFPGFVASKYRRGEFVRRLPKKIRDGISRYGIRNSHLTAIAPAGSISLLANNLSSGMEPVYHFQHLRHLHREDGALETVGVSDYAYRLFRHLCGPDAPLPPSFKTAVEVNPRAQLAMQAALQQHVDNAISKTTTVPPDFEFKQFCTLYQEAYHLGLKGCTSFRPNPVTGECFWSPLKPW